MSNESLRDKISNDIIYVSQWRIDPIEIKAYIQLTREYTYIYNLYYIYIYNMHLIIWMYYNIHVSHPDPKKKTLTWAVFKIPPSFRLIHLILVGLWGILYWIIKILNILGSIFHYNSSIKHHVSVIFTNIPIVSLWFSDDFPLCSWLYIYIVNRDILHIIHISPN